MRDDVAEPQKLQLALQGVREAEQQSRRPRPDRVPVTEDHGGQRDEPAAVRHQALEGSDRLEAQERAGQSGERAADHHVQIARPDHVDADRVGRARVLADRAHPQPPTRVIQHDLRGHDQDERQVRDRRVVEQHRADDRDLRQPRDRDGRQFAGQRDVRRVEIPGQADRQDVDDRAADDLIDAQMDAERPVQQRQQRAGEDGPEHAEPQVARGRGRDKAHEGRCEHHALDADVDHAGSLGEDAAEGAEDDRRRQPQRAAEDGHHHQGDVAAHRFPHPALNVVESS